MPDQPEELIHLTLRGKPDGFPLALRVRRLLKYAARALGLSCVAVDWKPAPTPGVPQDATKGGEAARESSENPLP
jgi:hypothetical protein